MRLEIRGSVLVLISAGCFGAGSIALKLAYSEGASPIFVLTARFIIAAVVLWIYNFLIGEKERYMVTRKQLFILFLLGGVVYWVFSYFLSSAYNYIPVSLGCMVFYLYPVLVNIFGVLFFKEKLASRQAVVLIMAFSGTIMMVWAPGIYLNWFGIFLAVIAALSYSAYLILMGSRYTEGLDSITVTTYISTFSALTSIIAGILTNQLRLSLSLKGWGAIAFLAVFSTVIAIILLYRGIKYISASRASIISTFEPVVAVSLGILILGETLNIYQITGAIFIIAAVVLINRTNTDVSSGIREETDTDKIL